MFGSIHLDISDLVRQKLIWEEECVVYHECTVVKEMLLWDHLLFCIHKHLLGMIPDLSKIIVKW